MSIEGKVNALFKGSLENLENRKKELQDFEFRVHSLMDKVEREIKNRIDSLEERQKELSDKQSDFEKEKIRWTERKRREEERLIKSVNNEKEAAQASIEQTIQSFREILPINSLLTEAYIQALFFADSKVEKLYRNQSHASLKALDTIRGYKKENRDLRIRIKDLEYLLAGYWEDDDATREDFEDAPEDVDTVKFFISNSDYSRLSETERNQLALDRYLRKNHSKRYVGLMYEREVGHLFETQGYDVSYRGIEKGLEDGGIDLICQKNGETLFVQCKNWSKEKFIYEKHICQLFGATQYYADELFHDFNPTLFDTQQWKNIIPVFVTTTQLDEHAKAVAHFLKVIVLDDIPFTKHYPMIKCNINSKGERIYHLPFDQMYDKTKIINAGEDYAWTVVEAESKGFRRAHRWSGNQ